MKLTPTNLWTPCCLIVIIFTSCNPACPPCDDPYLTKVGSSSTLTINFEVSTAVRHSNGTATSSISIAPDGSNVQLSMADSVTTNVYLTGIDTSGGIKCLELSGGWGATCRNQNNNLALSMHGILPQERQCLPLTTCCLKTNRIAMEDLKQYLKCPDNHTLNTGGIQVVGIVETCIGRRDTAFLTLEPMGL
jgi:hypothetical protein